MSKNLNRKRSAAAVAASDVQAPSSYRDDPDAVSMHTTRSDYEYDDMPDLPSYDDSVAADPPPTLASQRSSFPDGYRSIAQPTLSRGQQSGSQKVSIGCETSIRMDPKLMDPAALYEYITNYLQHVPPRPIVRIQGWHWEMRQELNNKKKNQKERVFDFDVLLSLQHYLAQPGDANFWSACTVENSDKAHRGGFRQTRAKGYKQDIEVGEEPRPDLMAWCKEFCESRSWLKIFRVSRSISGLDTEELKPQLERMVKSTHYRGHVDITFPTVDKNVEIYSPHWINTARITWIRWLFYLTFLWLITWPILFFMTKRWSVYHVKWHWSLPRSNERDKSYATISETAWLERHANLIRSLVMDKYHGDATDLPTNVSVDTERRRSEIRVPQVNVGRGGIGAAVSLLQGGVSVWNQANGRGDAGWGADQC